MFILKKNYRSSFYIWIFATLILLIGSCDGCDIEPTPPSIDFYNSPCTPPQTDINLAVNFPIEFASAVNSCVAASTPFELPNPPAVITLDDIYTDDFYDFTKYHIQLYINGRCESGELYEEVFNYSDLDFINESIFWVPEFETGDGTVTLRLLIKTPCLNNCINPCGGNTAYTMIVAIREDVILDQISGGIIFDYSDFQLGMTQCDC